MATEPLSPAQRRTALRALGRDALAELTEQFNLDVGDRRVIDDHVDALILSRSVTFEDVLTLLYRDELKTICAALGLDTRGRSRQRLINRILGKPAPPSKRKKKTQNVKPPDDTPQGTLFTEPPASAPAPQVTVKAPSPPGPGPARLLPERAPKVGELVQVRSRRWLVEDVAEPKIPGQTVLVSLACADDDAQGQTLEVFWDYEPDRRILEEEGWSHLASRVDEVMVRRLKEDIRAVQGGFPHRDVRRLVIDGLPADEGADWTGEELEAEENAQIEAASAAAEAESSRDAAAEVLWRREQALLDRMQEIAERSRHLPDV